MSSATKRFCCYVSKWSERMITWRPSSICWEEKSEKKHPCPAVDSCPTWTTSRCGHVLIRQLLLLPDSWRSTRWETFRYIFSLIFAFSEEITARNFLRFFIFFILSVSRLTAFRWKMISLIRWKDFCFCFDPHQQRALISETSPDITHIFCGILLLSLFKSDTNDCKSTTARGSFHLQTKPVGRRLSCSLSTVISVKTLRPAVVTHLQCFSTSWAPGDPLSSRGSGWYSGFQRGSVGFVASNLLECLLWSCWHMSCK